MTHSQHPYLTGAYAPVFDEPTIELERIEGELPADLEGAYVRNGPNPRFPPRGRHHWFDGDGMLHAVHFEGGRATYRRRWIRTAGFEVEERAGEARWSGLLEPTCDNPEGAPYKDTSNTDVVSHRGWLLTTWYISGAAYRVDPLDLRTDGPATFGRERPLRMSAHAKVDRATGELLFFDYGPTPPYLRYGVISDGGELVHRVDIDLPGPRLPHDMAFTERYAILMDLSVYPRPEALAQKRWLVAYHPNAPARFGILPRRGDGSSIRWFEAEPCYVYHAVNAWEDGHKVVLVGCRCVEPMPTPDPADGPLAKSLATLRLSARLYRWTFDLETGLTTEEPLDDLDTEFPKVAEDIQGQPSRYSYHVRIPRARTLLFDGLVKYDHRSGERAVLSFGEGAFGSEAPFAPRSGVSPREPGHEDDGYLLSFVDDRARDRSELWVVDARDLARGPVARLHVPTRVPLGFHATWVPEAELAEARKRTTP